MEPTQMADNVMDAKNCTFLYNFLCEATIKLMFSLMNLHKQTI